MNIRTSTIALGIGVVATFMSFSSFATYKERIAAGGWKSTATVTYKNAGRNYSKSIRNAEVKKITDKVSMLHRYERDLSQKVRDSIQEKINGKASITSYRFDVIGDLEIKLTGLPDGTIQAKVGNISVSSHVGLKRSWYARGSISLSSNKLTLTGKYNPYTGKLTNLVANSNFDVRSSVDFDSILDIIPGFNWLVTNKVEDLAERELENGVISALNTRLYGYEDVLFGLDRYLPKNTYVFNGVDYAVKVRDAFRDLVSNESITIKVSQTKKTLLKNGYVMLDHLNINISNHLFVKVSETPTVERFWDSGCLYSEFCEPEP
ncbi:hypothetical protein [Pseudoalteromonas rubra]|uniref:Uncharacterized protein n=1 Tax=Pseudoalteromonas rubra TaxID=43658 RepID=A0A5S3X6S5_9GAMM|nr:hypothetical protein [Pseudoalteromonas rubra]TMP39655.1 hypothetical protein CWB98_03450 [Pseudoalteromonas rubra]